jgi:hypothetical protein
MNVYTDRKLLDVHGALAMLPALPIPHLCSTSLASPLAPKPDALSHVLAEFVSAAKKAAYETTSQDRE